MFGFGFDDVSVMPVPLAISDYYASTNGFQLGWPARAGLNYVVQYKTNLAQGDWEDLCTCPAWTNVATFLDTNLTGACGPRYYRLKLAP